MTFANIKLILRENAPILIAGFGATMIFFAAASIIIAMLAWKDLSRKLNSIDAGVSLTNGYLSDIYRVETNTNSLLHRQ